MTDYRLILQLLLQGFSYRDIQSQALCSHASISKASGVIKQRGLQVPSDLEGVAGEEIASWFVEGRRSISDDVFASDFEAIIHARRHQAKKTLKQLWLDYCQLDAPAGQRHYGFDRFRELINTYVDVNDLAATMTYAPGHTMQVDWAGTNLDLAEALSGAKIRLEVFVAQLPYSGMIAVSFALSRVTVCAALVAWAEPSHFWFSAPHDSRTALSCMSKLLSKLDRQGKISWCLACRTRTSPN